MWTDQLVSAHRRSDSDEDRASVGWSGARPSSTSARWSKPTTTATAQLTSRQAAVGPSTTLAASGRGRTVVALPERQARESRPKRRVARPAALQGVRGRDNDSPETRCETGSHIFWMASRWRFTVIFGLIEARHLVHAPASTRSRRRVGRRTRADIPAGARAASVVVQRLLSGAKGPKGWASSWRRGGIRRCLRGGRQGRGWGPGGG